MACLSEAPEAIVFELKEPFRVIERLLSPSRDDRFNAGKCHPVNMGATGRFCPMSGGVDFTQENAGDKRARLR